MILDAGSSELALKVSKVPSNSEVVLVTSVAQKPKYACLSPPNT